MEAWADLKERLERLKIYEQDLTEKFVRSGGPGGQNVNKVSTCVILTHKPSGIIIRCEEERSQAQNRILARKRLADRLEMLARARLFAERAGKERVRRQKRQRSKGAKAHMLKNKRHRALLKNFRKPPTLD